MGVPGQSVIVYLFPETRDMWSRGRHSQCLVEDRKL